MVRGRERPCMSTRSPAYVPAKSGRGGQPLRQRLQREHGQDPSHFLVRKDLFSADSYFSSRQILLVCSPRSAAPQDREACP